MQHERTQSLDALSVANATRVKRAELRRQLREGELPLSAVMTDPPPELLGDPLVDIVRVVKPARRAHWFEALGRRAALDGINLCISLERASTRSREWVAQQASSREGSS